MAESNRHPAESYVDRIVALEENRRELAADIKEIYAEAADSGLTGAALRMVVKRQLESLKQRKKRESVENEAGLIMAALGMLAGTPLGDSAIRKSHRNGHTTEVETAP